MAKYNIRSEYTAQASTFQPNRMVRFAIESLFRDNSYKVIPRQSKVADQGCGKLRHLEILTEYFQKIYLVDQHVQLTRKQSLFGNSNTTIIDYIKRNFKGDHIRILPSTKFAKTKLNLDIVLNACTFDVVPPNSRNEMTIAAYCNLRMGGVFVLIIPRNDQSILKRCHKENKYWDGYVFSHHGIHTFFRNFRNHIPLIEIVEKTGFELLKDISVYRHICLIFKKSA